MATAADVPGKYDVIINGQGYVLLDALTPNIPFRTHRAIYTYSPTFLERTNVTGAWGDNQQAFWLTFSQNDWSGGEGLKFARPNDPAKANRYWLGAQVDNTIPGQIMPFRLHRTLTFSPLVYHLVANHSASFYTCSSTNLFEVDSSAGTITDRGAHGAGSTATVGHALAFDGQYVYIAGATKIRRFDIAALTFADFSANALTDLCFQNNTLFGATNGVFSQFDTSGSKTDIYTFKSATGTTSASWKISRIIPFGGQVALALDSSEIYIYNGVGVERIAGLPRNFTIQDMSVCDEILVIAGWEKTYAGSRMSIYYYANGSIGNLYRDTVYSNPSNLGGLAVTPWGNGFVFADASRNAIRYFDLGTGSVSSLGVYNGAASALGAMATTPDGQVMFVQYGTTSQQLIQDNINLGDTATVYSSLIDFDSSLKKYVKGVTVDFDSTGGGTVDLGYQTDTVDGSWTTLASNVTSGTEYAVNLTCHSISVKVFLNPGVSGGSTPILKRLYVRAVPELQTFRKREYILDLTGAAPDAPRRLRDGSPDPTVPFTGVSNLVAAAQATAPFSITDRLGTFTGIIEPDGFEIYEMHAQQQDPSKSGSYVVKVSVREV